jgi:hypothetical protein
MVAANPADCGLSEIALTFPPRVVFGEEMPGNGAIAKHTTNLHIEGQTMPLRTILSLAAIVGLCSPMARGDEASPLSALAKMPIREATVFKDGHALVLHKGKMPVEKSGDVLMDCLPSPVLGTFWPYSADSNAKLSAVVAGQRKVLVNRTSLELRELLEGNVGADVIVNEAGVAYPATIVGMPTRSSAELEATAPSAEGEKLPQKGNVVLLKTYEGVKVVGLDRIQQVTFRGPYKPTVASEEFRNLLRLKLDWGKRQPSKEAEMGLLYLQKGIRWIPSYKLVLDGKGNATVQLEATLINELADLDDVTANLVVGVPTFAFAETADPIGLGQRVAQLSQYFRQDAQTQFALSNALMSQTASRRGERVDAMQPPPSVQPVPRDLGPEVGGSEKSEDLFIFTLQHVTMKRGQRMVVPVTSFNVKYSDVFTVDIGFAPPPEVWRHFNSQQQADIARLAMAPKAMHKIRLTNTSKYPITTAPAMIFKENQVLGQGMTTYTPAGGGLDLPITTAVDILVKKTDKETGRTHNAITLENAAYAKIDVQGVVKLTNNRAAPVRIEVTRHVLGNATEANHEGKVTKQNVIDNDSVGRTIEQPSWWGWYSWPQWWTRFNGVASVTWQVDLEPGKSVDLECVWNYYWR